MKAVLLAAGYGTRMRSVSGNLPKALLRVGGKTVLDYLMDQILTFEAVDGTILVTNALFFDRFTDWADKREVGEIRILNDGTRSNDDRLGAIGDLRFAVDAARVDDDVLVAGTDNIFRFPIGSLVDFFREKGTDAIAVLREKDPERLARAGQVRLDEAGKVLDFAEKPPEPISDLICPPLYVFRRDTLPLTAAYLDSGQCSDAPGRFLAWLHSRRPVHGKIMTGGRHDIGSPETYREARTEMKKT